jgi:tetratricopeptide (TPR) repeat protein
LSDLKYALVYLELKPDYAKINNLPVKLPLLVQDYKKAVEKNKIPLETILRGLEAQYEVQPDEYYASYLVFYLYEKFKKLMEEDDLKGAEMYLEKAASILQDYRFHFYYGLLLKKHDQEELAEMELKQCTKENPSFAYGFYELGNLMFERKIYDEALDNFMKAIEVKKDFILSYLKIADVYMENGRYEEALDFLNQSLKIDKNFAPAYLRLGVIYNQLQRYKDAYLILNKATELENVDFEIYYNLSYTLQKLGRHREAKLAIEKALEKSKEDFILHEYALILKNLGLFQEAIEIEEQAFEIANEDNKDLILITLLKLSTIIEDVERVEKYYDLLQKEDLENSARLFYFFSTLSQNNIKDAKYILEQNKDTLYFESLIEKLNNLDFYIDRLENMTDERISNSILNSITEEGTIDGKELSEQLKTRGYNGISLAWLKEDNLQEAKSKPEGVGILTNSLLLSGFNYALSERVNSMVSNLLWKDGEGLAFSKLLQKFYIDRVFGEKSPLEVFVEQNLEEVKDMNYKLSKVLVDYDIITIDYDTLMETKMNNFEDAIKVFISALRLDFKKSYMENDEFKDKNVKDILEFVLNLNDF